MGLCQNRLCARRPSNRWTFSSKFCTSSTHDGEQPQNVDNGPPSFHSNEYVPKTITEMFTHAMKMTEAQRIKNRTKTPRGKVGTAKLLKPAENYTSRFDYNGYLKSKRWQYYDDVRLFAYGPETEEQYNYRLLKKQKFCILMGFAGGNYFGMQYNKGVHTVEEVLLNAMVHHRWILMEHIRMPWLVDFQRGSRTDRGVSAARQNVSLNLRKCILYRIFDRKAPCTKMDRIYYFQKMFIV